MSGKFPSRGDFDITSALKDEYEWIADGMIDGINGVNCTLIYPPVLAECPNCYLDPASGRSSNMYKTDGPSPFTNHTLCPVCYGEGRQSENPTEVIKMRVYIRPKDWVNLGLLNAQSVENPDALVQVIGYMHELYKVQQSIAIILYSDFEDVKRIRCKAAGDAFPHGLGGGRRYFIQMLQRLS